MGLFDAKQSQGQTDDTAFMNELSGDGLEDLTRDQLRVPFLRILQPGSPQCKEGKEGYIEGAKPGMFFNTVTGKLYGNSINVIPVKPGQAWIEWKPKRGGFVARHEPYSIEVEKREWNDWWYNGNQIQDTMEFYVLLVDYIQDGILIFPMSSSGMKHAKNWNTMITNVRLNNGKQAPYYSSVWNLTTISIPTERGDDYYQVGDKTSLIKRVRWITKEDLMLYIKPVRDNIKELTANVDYKQIEAPKEDLSENIEY